MALERISDWLRVRQILPLAARLIAAKGASGKP
jgi:hypothetical protein